jgi:hypothetical protein
VKVPAGGICKEKTVCFLKTPFTKVVQLVGFALTDEDDREPAATLTTLAAGAGSLQMLGGFHTSTSGSGMTKREWIFF